MRTWNKTCKDAETRKRSCWNSHKSLRRQTFGFNPTLQLSKKRYLAIFRLLFLSLANESCQVKELEAERNSILSKLEDTERQLRTCQMELQDERDNRSSEASGWGQSISEKSRLCEELQSQVRELQNELASVRRKHAVNIKVRSICLCWAMSADVIHQIPPGTDTGTESDQKAS